MQVPCWHKPAEKIHATPREKPSSTRTSLRSHVESPGGPFGTPFRIPECETAYFVSLISKRLRTSWFTHSSISVLQFAPLFPGDRAPSHGCRSLESHQDSNQRLQLNFGCVFFHFSSIQGWEVSKRVIQCVGDLGFASEFWEVD